jgi:hypothetical protein
MDTNSWKMVDVPDTNDITAKAQGKLWQPGTDIQCIQSVQFHRRIPAEGNIHDFLPKA